MRKTKITCTIGPATERYENLEMLAEHGMNIARLNMSHGDHTWHGNIIRHIKSINEKAKYSISLLLDTKGPEIRSGDVKQGIELKKGENFIFTIKKQAEYEKNMVEVNYDGFVDDVAIGDIILVDGGMMSFLVKEKTDTDILCETIDPGTLKSRRHLNIRGKSAQLSAITEKDWEDIRFGIEQGVDFIALSFINEAAVIYELREYLETNNSQASIIAKIESVDAITNLDEILDACDGAMVARGDLGSELPFEEVPLLQEEIVRKCRERGKPVIVATQLLESMMINPTPTRAEVTDITQAVLQEADSVMLSGETAAGIYPFRCVEVMDTVVRRIEEKLAENKTIHVRAVADSKLEIVRSAAIIANNLNIEAMIVITRRGHTAELLSKCRPNADIFAFTNTPYTRRWLNMFWGVQASRIELSSDPEKTVQRALKQLFAKDHIQKGQQVVVVSDILAGDHLIETIQIRTV